MSPRREFFFNLLYVDAVKDQRWYAHFSSLAVLKQRVTAKGRKLLDWRWTSIWVSQLRFWNREFGELLKRNDVSEGSLFEASSGKTFICRSSKLAEEEAYKRWWKGRRVWDYHEIGTRGEILWRVLLGEAGLDFCASILLISKQEL